jgi:hypothetical protein
VAILRWLRCNRCGRWFGRHRHYLVGDGKTDNTCAFQWAADVAVMATVRPRRRLWLHLRWFVRHPVNWIACNLGGR